MAQGDPIIFFSQLPEDFLCSSYYYHYILYFKVNYNFKHHYAKILLKQYNEYFMLSSFQ